MMVGGAGASFTVSFYPSERLVYGKEVKLIVGFPELSFCCICIERTRRGRAEVRKQWTSLEIVLFEGNALSIFMDLATALLVLVVGALWGSTNALIHLGTVEQLSDGRRYPRPQGKLSRVFGPVLHLYNMRVGLPYLANQAGSLLFYKLLASKRTSHQWSNSFHKTQIT